MSMQTGCLQILSNNVNNWKVHINTTNMILSGKKEMLDIWKYEF